MRSRNWTLGVTALLCGAALPLAAATPPSLGNAGSFAVLAGSEVTNTGLTTINGDVGISPGIGSLPHYHDNGTVTFIGGAVHDADLAAQNAQADKNAAYGALDQTCDFSFAGTKELAGLSLVPGVYCAASFHLTAGTLTLTGVSSDTWIFKSGSDLIMTGGAAAKVVSPSCSVWWRVVSTATFDAGSSLTGNILADTSITLAAGASLTGKALARSAEVTLSSNTITACTLIALTPTVTGTPPTSTPTVTGTPPTSTQTATPVATSTSGPFPTATPAVAVPTTSGGAMIVLAGLLALVAFAVIRRSI
jgi:type VI secretion system secreted protein VgrG